MINFMRHRNLYFLISLLVILPGLFSLAKYRLQPGIDFTGGSLLEIKIDSAEEIGIQKIKDQTSDVFEFSSIQTSGEKQYLFRGKELDNQTKDHLLSRLDQLGPVEVLRFETVGPILGQELLQKTLLAAAIVATFITLFVWRQFSQLKYGVCAILAMIHDSLVLLGSFSLLGHFYGLEVDVLFVTALMTTLSFSVHDTIVVYDRIRELRRKQSRLSYLETVNLAINQTLRRSINNSLTIIMMLTVLVILGGDSIRNFALALLIGAITGTYSSTFTAAPLLLLWDQLAGYFRKRK